MAINLDKNKEALLAAWNDVVSDKSRTDWALFGYEGNTMFLKVVSKGDGGLEEMTEDLNSGKIMYAFCKVLDPNTSLPKLVLINWQGEAAPMERKGICANHLRDVTNFLKGAHVTINARTEDDVDSDLIISKVAKSTVSSFNFKERSAPAPAPKPVGSVYKRTIPTAEINPVERDKFWEKEEIEERKRVEEDRRKAERVKQLMEEERKRRELEEAKARELRVRERSLSISHLREAEQLAANGGDAERQRWEQQMVSDKQDEEERRRRSESLRNQRKQEAQTLIAQRNFNARAVFEQNSAAGQLNNRPRSHSLQTHSLFSVAHAKDPHPTSLSNTHAKDPHATSLSNAHAKDPHVTSLGNAHQNNTAVETKPKQVEVDQRPMARPDVIPLTPPQVSPPSVSPVEVLPTPVPTPQPAVQQAIIPPAQSILKHGLPRRQPDSDHSEQEDDQEWNTPAQVPTTTATTTTTSINNSAPPLTAPTKAVEPPAEVAPVASNQPDVTTNDLTEQEKLEQQYNLYQQALREQELLELELRARALYDYQAADDTEISFDPDDIITHIEQIDEGWWQGMAPDGTYGLFPANYVELID